MVVRLPARHEPLGGPLACKQCYYPGGQEHVTLASLRHASQLGPSQHLHKQSAVMTLVKLPLLCGRVAVCFKEVCHSNVKTLQCLLQFIRMWHRGPNHGLLSMIALFLCASQAICYQL